MVRKGFKGISFPIYSGVLFFVAMMKMENPSVIEQQFLSAIILKDFKWFCHVLPNKPEVH